jgi:hypothetical protein
MLLQEATRKNQKRLEPHKLWKHDSHVGGIGLSDRYIGVVSETWG